MNLERVGFAVAHPISYFEEQLNDQYLPTGLSFDFDTRILSGTPTIAHRYRSVGYQVQGGPPDAPHLVLHVRHDFEITVLPQFTLDTISNMFFTPNQDIGMVQLPEANSGIGAKTYSLEATDSSTGIAVGDNVDSNRLPLGLSFDPSTRTLSGTLTVATRYDMQYRATDEEGVSITQTFAIGPAQPIAAIAQESDKAYLVGRPMERLVLPTTTGGGGQLSYSLRTEIPAGSTGVLDSSNSAVPAGMILGSQARFLEGTPTVTGQYLLHYTAQDERGISQQMSFRVNVVPALTLDRPQNQTYGVGQQVRLVLPAGNDGLGEKTHGLTATTSDGTLNAQNLPDGLAFNADTRTLSGTPTALGTYTMTYTANDDSVDNPLTQTFSITVVPALTLDRLDDRRYLIGQQVRLVLPEGNEGAGGRTYGLSATTPDGTLNADNLPDGLAFNADTRTLSGAPTAPGTYTMTYTADDSSIGNALTRSFRIYVATGRLALAVPEDQTYVLGRQVRLVLPEGTGGIGDRTYDLTATTSDGTLNTQLLPDGLTFDTNTRTLSGTPTTLGTYRMTWAASDDSVDNAVTQTFRLKVALQLTLDVPENRTYSVGQQIRLVLPEGNDGGGDRTYGLTATTADGILNARNLPNGLAFNADSRTLSGAPTAVGTYAMTYRAADDSVDNPLTQSFNIEVVPVPLTLDAPEDQTWRIAQQVRLVLPEGNNGLGEKTYGLTATTADGTLNAENLPDGLAFNADTRTLSGAPTTEGTYAMIWTAEDDSIDNPLTQTFSIRVVRGTDPTQMATSEEVQHAAALALAVSASRSVGNRIDQWLSGNLGTASVAPDGSALSMPLTAEGSTPGGGGPSLWLRAGEQQLANTEDTLSWDGDLSEIQLGFDGQLGDRLLIGVMISQSEGSFDYLDSSDETLQGDYTNETQVVSPWLAWAISDGAHFWLMVSAGTADISTLNQSDEELDAEFGLTTTLSGIDLRLKSGPVSSLRLKAEVANISFDHLGAIQETPASSSDTQLRASIRSTHRLQTAGGAIWTPSIQMALRDNALGSGLELGGSLSYISAGSRLSVEGGLRTLQADNYEETGAWLSLRLKMSANRRGLSFHLTPASGMTESRADALWHKAAQPLHQHIPHSDNSDNARLSGEIAWGLPTGPRSTLTPYSQWEQSASSTRRALGLRWQTGTHFQLSLESHRQHYHTTHPDQGLQLQGKLSF